ncbi:DUF4270 domain-containing protein [Confluentibacter citreus]|uniref:DUF4270 domain-containing protein n=1 Tax=Confluentibacter citreus TaxID=2007307 RepID=UPI000C28205B|nr:DUF4270 domain-containing protein [Confluentibacter citreus]
MKKIFKALNFTGISLFLIISVVACDKDFSTVESDVLGEDNINFNTGKVNLPITAYNKKLDSLQINNLSSNLLGVFNDPAYGQTTASIITQISPSPSGFNPDFGDNPVIDSVVLTIPYFSRTITDSTYTISDSLYGNGPIHLSIYKNNYFLRDFDPNSPTNARQNYYSKADGSINTTDNFAMSNNTIINFDTNRGELLFEDAEFVPSNKTIVTVTMDEDSTITRTKSAPALRAKLDVNFWKTTIIDKEGQPELSNENNFKNYFRGLYLKAQSINDNGNLVLLNLASTSSNVTIYYSKDDTAATGERTQSTYILNLASTASININRLNTFINNYSLVTLTNGDKTLGDEKLYLKGAEGSMAVVDLFSGMVECENEDGTTSIVTALECFKKTYRVPDGNGGYKKDSFGNFILKQLINEARLVIYEDEGMVGPTDYHKYDRIYAYDVKNNTPTIDYIFDPITNSSSPLSSKIVSLGQRDPAQLKYKIRLTEHLKSILIRDSTNTKIGLVLSSNVNLTDNSKILNSNNTVTNVPSTSIITPRGTILHGTNANVPENKRMSLEIFFTEPK